MVPLFGLSEFCEIQSIGLSDTINQVCPTTIPFDFNINQLNFIYRSVVLPSIFYSTIYWNDTFSALG